MANAAKMALKQPVRMLITGYPGAGKTGALAALANVGYKLRVIDFDGNTQSLITYTDPDKLANIDIVYLEDKMRNGQRFIETTGVPTAFSKALDLMDRWKYKEDDGVETDLGQSKDWGCDTVLVVDGLSGLNNASFRRQMSLSNKTPLNVTQQVWGLAMAQEEAFIEKLTSEANRFHVIVLSHLKMIGPKDVLSGDADVTKDLKERAADIVPTRLFPNALGQQLSPMIGGHFPALVLIENEFKAGKAEQVIRTMSRPELDLKLASRVSFDKVGIKDGLAKIFAEIAPPLGSCGDQPKEKTI